MLRESIKAKNVDSFHWHLNELERVVQNNEGMKRLLEQDGTLCYAAYIGSNPVVKTVIRKGVGKYLSRRDNLKSLVAGQSICECYT